MAGNRSATLLRPSRDWTPLTLKGALTLSAGVVTDVTRLAGVQGDGKAYPFGGVYVGPAATNLGDAVGDMSFESLAVGSNMATDGWTNSTGGTAVISDEVVKFGTKSGKLTTGGASAFQRLELPLGSLAAGTYTWPVWLYAPAPLTKVRVALSNATDGSTLTSDLSVTNVWQLVSVTKTTTVTEAVTAIIYVSYGVNTSGAVLYLSGPMPVLSPIALPFTPTSRVAGDAYATTFSSLVNPTKGWMFVRGRFGVSDAVAPAGGYGLAECNRSDGTSRTTLTWTPAMNQLNVARVGGGSSGSLGGSPAITPALGDYVTAGMGWSASLIGTATNGNAFTTQADTNIGGAFDRITFGGRRSGSPFCGDILWAVIGSEDTWDTALSVLMDSFGNNDPLPHQIPRKYGPVDLVPFNGDGSAHRYAA